MGLGRAWRRHALAKACLMASARPAWRSWLPRKAPPTDGQNISIDPDGSVRGISRRTNRMRLLLAGTFIIALGMACVSREKAPLKTEVVTFPEGAIVEFNGRRVGRAPAAVILPQDTNGRLTERAVFRAVPNTAQAALYAQSRVLEPSARDERVPNRIMIDLTLRDTNSAPLTLAASSTSTHVETSSKTGKVARPRPADRGKPTQPVGMDRWNPGIY